MEFLRQLFFGEDESDKFQRTIEHLREQVKLTEDPQEALLKFIEFDDEKASLIVLEEFLKNHPFIIKSTYPEHLNATILHLAVQANSLELASYLLKRGANHMLRINDEPGYTALHLVLKNTFSSLPELDVAQIEKVIHFFQNLPEEIDINSATDRMGNTILHYMMEKADRLPTAYLIKIANSLPGINFNSLNREGNTPLHKVATIRHPYQINYQLQAAYFLIQEGANSRKANIFNITPTDLAAYLKNDKLYKWLYEPSFSKGAYKPYILNIIETVLPKDLENVKYQNLKASILINPSNILVEMMVHKLPIDCIKKFLSLQERTLNKAKILLTINYAQALMTAIEYAYFEIIPILLMKGLNINYQDKAGYGALHLFTQIKPIKDIRTFYWDDIVMGFKKILKTKNINVNLQDKEKNTALHYFIQEGRGQWESKIFHNLLDCLLEHKLININIPNNTGNTPLHNLVLSKNLSFDDKKILLNKFIKLGAENKVNNQQKTPLELAKSLQDDQMVELFNQAHFSQISHFKNITQVFRKAIF